MYCWGAIAGWLLGAKPLSRIGKMRLGDYTVAQRGVGATLEAGGSGLHRHFHVGLAGELTLFYSRAMHAPLQNKRPLASLTD